MPISYVLSGNLLRKKVVETGLMIKYTAHKRTIVFVQQKVSGAFVFFME